MQQTMEQVAETDYLIESNNSSPSLSNISEETSAIADNRRHNRSRDRSRSSSRPRSRRPTTHEDYERDAKSHHSSHRRRREDRSRSRSRHGSPRSRRSRHSDRSVERSSSDYRRSKPRAAIERRFVSDSWDVPAVGYESYKPLQYKAILAASQVAPDLQLPVQATAAPNMRQDNQNSAYNHNNNTNGTNIIYKQKEMGGMGGTAVIKNNRRLYIGNVPSEMTDNDLAEFMNAQLINSKLVVGPGAPVMHIQINPEKKFAFVELRNEYETSYALNLDGIVHLGSTLRIRRPKDYVPSSNPAEGESYPLPQHSEGAGITNNNNIYYNNISQGAAYEQSSGQHSGQAGSYYGAPPTHQHYGNISVSSQVRENEFKLYLGNLSSSLSDEEVKDLLSVFGQLRGFTLVKDATTGISRGYAFCEFLDPSATQLAIQGLHEMEIAGRKIAVQLADRKGAPSSNMGGANLQRVGGGGYMTTNPHQQQQQQQMLPTTPQTVLILLNIIEINDLDDDEEYMDIIDDIRTECTNYGRVLDVIIPRYANLNQIQAQIYANYHGKIEITADDIGKVFVKYEYQDQAHSALQQLSGRLFGSKRVVGLLDSWD